MRAGVLLTFQNLHENLSDFDVHQIELGLAASAEDLGFDTLWAVEHHFGDYAMCPDNFALLAYLAGRTSTITLATGAVILPWNDPLRVAEKAVMLDYLSNGRFRLGLGRGLARMEYEGFGIDMNSSRERFDDAAEAVLEALRTGRYTGREPYYPHAPVDLRPRPLNSFDGRVYAVGISPDSVSSAARLGAGLMAFIQYPMERHAEAFETYRSQFVATRGAEPKPPVLAQQMFCHADPEIARQRAYEYISQYYVSVVRHYDFGGEHFASTMGYQSYSEGARLLREAGLEASAEGYVDYQLWGTPDQILEKLRGYKKLIGDFESVVVPSFAEMTPEETRSSFELFGREVVPELHRL